MHNLLLACKQLSFSFDENAGLAAADSDELQVHTRINMTRSLSIQAIGTTTPDIPPTEENGATKRDCEYARFGSSELLATIDLLTGKAFPLVSAPPSA